MDVPTVYELSRHSGGDVHYYPQFQASIHGEKLCREMVHTLTRTMGWEGVMRVRVSTGYKITAFSGHLHIRGTDLIVLPNCHADQTIGISIEPAGAEGGEQATSLVAVQAALLYTNS